MPSVTAVIPTYNRSETLGRALDSVVGQSVAPDEIIVVDDGSTDETDRVVARFPGVQYLRLPVNTGAAAARNAGVLRATGELIAFLDSDDTWESSKIERQLAYLRGAPHVLLLCCGITVHDRAGRARYHDQVQSKPKGSWTFAEFMSYPFSTPTWLVKRDALMAAGLFDPQLPNCEDLDLLAKLNLQGAIEVLREPLVVKYNLWDSLDADVRRRSESLDVLLSRHEGLWLRSPAVAADSCRRVASLCFRAGSASSGRSYLRRALRFQPWSPAVWSMYGLSFLGKGAYLGMQQLLRRPGRS